MRAAVMSGTAFSVEKTAAPTFFVKLWLVFLPITSVLIIPFVQGTTPGNLIALALLLPMTQHALFGAVRSEFYRRLFALLAIFMLSVLLSQLALSLSNLNPGDLLTVSLASLLPGFYFRLSIFSQGLYLLTGFITLVTFQLYYERSWDKWLRIGAVFLALYGLYEVAFDLVFGHSGDFLSNRSFEGGNFSGSLEQRHSLFGVPLLRLKSLTGEASMYSLTMIPYIALSLERRWTLTSLLLIATLVLTVSTTGYFGLAFVGGFMLLRWAKARNWCVAVEVWAALLTIVVVSTVFSDAFSIFQHVVVEKLSGTDRSGAARFGAFSAAIALWCKGGLFTQLFGIGFGYIRSTDLLSTLLTNVGIIGLLLWLYLYLAPAWRLMRAGYVLDWRIAATLGMLIAMLVGVPEFAYLIPWAFLGLSYNTSSSQIKNMADAKLVH